MKWLIWVGTMGVMAIATWLGLHTPFHHALFPELAALSFGLLSQPEGRWAQKPWAVAVAPTLAGALGVIMSRLLGFSPLSVALTVCGTLLLLALLRSSVAPALSAGLLAVVVGVTDPLYPLAILAGGVIVVAVHATYVRLLPSVSPSASTAVQHHHVATRRQVMVAGVIVSVFAAAVALLARATGLPFLLFPPLVVLTYEMFENPDCPWAGKPVACPLSCLLSASVGLLVHAYLGATIFGVVLTVAGGLCILAVMDLHMPPVLAVGLLPFIMLRPTWAYPLSVTGGIVLAVILHTLWQRLMMTRQPVALQLEQQGS